MTILNWIIAITAGICGLWITGANWLVLIRWCRTKCTASTIPFVGGALLTISLFNTPLKNFCWVGLLIDYGFWTGIFGLPYLIKQMLDEYRNRK